MAEGTTVLTFENPLHIRATIAFTMSIEDWSEILKAMRDAPSTYGPTGNMKKAIEDAIGRAKTTLRVQDAAPDA